MFRALVANLVAHERIETTDAKAKELRRVAERTITRAIRLGPIAYTPQAQLGDRDRARRLGVARQIGSFLHRFGTVRANGAEKSIDLVEKVMVDLAQRFRDRPGGYTRIIKLGPRRGDNAPMVIVELVEGHKVATVDPEDKRTAKAAQRVKDKAKEKADAKKADEAKAEAAEPAKAEAVAEPAKADKAKAAKKAKAEPAEAAAAGDEPKPKKRATKKAKDE